VEDGLMMGERTMIPDIELNEDEQGAFYPDATAARGAVINGSDSADEDAEEDDPHGICD